MTFNFLGPGLTVNVEAKVKEQIILDSSGVLCMIVHEVSNDKFRYPTNELPPKKATLKEVAFCVKSIQLKRNNWSVLFLENSKVIEK